MHSDGSFPKLSVSEVAELDEQDRLARLEAKRNGHTHPIASGSATRVDGTTVGRVQS